MLAILGRLPLSQDHQLALVVRLGSFKQAQVLPFARLVLLILMGSRLANKMYLVASSVLGDPQQMECLLKTI